MNRFEIFAQLIWVYAAGVASVSEGAWCWISPAFPIERIVMQYGIIAAVMCCLFLIYVGLICYMRKKSQGIKSAKKTIMKLIGFPIVYFLAFSPLTIVRIVNVFVDLPLEAAYATVVFEPCDGIFNVLWYGYTRKIFCRKDRTAYNEINRSSTGSLAINSNST